VESLNTWYSIFSWCEQLTLAGYEVPTNTGISVPFPSWTQERKYSERFVEGEKGRERSLTSYRHGKTRLNSVKLI